jgi:DNA polymerase III epsilon subunit-like protein
VNVLIVDTETTGLSPEKGAECIEIGAILYNVLNRAILAQVSTVLAVKAIGQEETHGINLDIANAVPFNVQSAAINLLSNMVLSADYAVAHNATFDQQFAPACIDIPWLCTYEDFNFAPYKKQNLVGLALAHGITVKLAHRALTDCGLIAEIFSKRDDLEALIEAAVIRSTSSKVWVRALVDFHSKDLAKAARFEWKRESKDWRKQMKQCDLESLDFGCEIID